MKEILSKSKLYPEVFHHVGLFCEGIGPDRLSDMVSNIIKEDIILYTKKILRLLNINKSNYPHLQFDENNFLLNPNSGKEILFLPKEILHELPIAENWEDIDKFINRNQLIRNEFNEIVGTNLSKVSKSEKKNYIKNRIFLEEIEIEKFISEYKKFFLEKYDYDNDSVGHLAPVKKVKELINTSPFRIGKDISIYDETIMICKYFKDLIENNKCYDILYEKNGKSRDEKIVQRTIFLGTRYMCEVHNIDISPESDAGRGPVDFKFSRGNEKVLVEVKLSTNSNLEHGYLVQIEEYAKAEKTDKKIFLLIDFGLNDERIKKLLKKEKEILEKYKEKINNHEVVFPEIIIVDAKPKKSASKF